MKDGFPEDHVELDAFGGYVNSIPKDATAFVHRDALYWCHLQAHWPNQNQNESRMAWIQGFYDELKPYLEGAYINAPDRDLPNALEEYYGSNLPRLREIKSQYDPENVFHYHQSVPPLENLI
jgi:FAD/FMN-containing dehydrogenase